MGKKVKNIKNDLKCDFCYYEGYRACLLDIMQKVMKAKKKGKKKNLSKEKD